MGYELTVTNVATIVDEAEATVFTKSGTATFATIGENTYNQFINRVVPIDAAASLDLVMSTFLDDATDAVLVLIPSVNCKFYKADVSDDVEADPEADPPVVAVESLDIGEPFPVTANQGIVYVYGNAVTPPTGVTNPWDKCRLTSLADIAGTVQILGVAYKAPAE